MKCRIFKKPDGRVIYSWPSAKYQDVPNFEGCKFPPETEGLPYVDLDESDLPSEIGRDWFAHGPLFMNGSPAKENLNFDEEWQQYLMPKNVVAKKHETRLQAQIDQELQKPVPDPLKVATLQSEKDKIKDWSDKQAYEQALANLEADGKDKPIIKQKLQEKIKALNP